MQFSIIAVLCDMSRTYAKNKVIRLIKYHSFKYYKTVSLSIALITCYSGEWKMYLHLKIQNLQINYMLAW